MAEASHVPVSRNESGSWHPKHAAALAGLILMVVGFPAVIAGAGFLAVIGGLLAFVAVLVHVFLFSFGGAGHGKNAGQREPQKSADRA